MRFGSTAKVPAECNLEYYRISECHVQEVTEAAPVSQGPDALLRTKMMKKRHREGYEEGVSVMHKPTSVAAFLAAKDPVSMLGQFSRSHPPP